MNADQRLRQRAHEQGGAFTRQDALSVGFTAAQVRHRLARGVWVGRKRGVYLVADEFEAASPSCRVRLLASAATLAHPGALASHQTAAALHGLPLLAAEDSRVHLTRAGWPRKPWYLGDVVVHAAGEPAPPTYRQHVPCTAPARTVVDVARWSSPLGGLVAADHALRMKMVRADELSAVLEAQARWPWAERAERVLRLASPLSESPGESFSRLFFAERGIEQPRQQVELHRRDGRLVARVDFLWPADGVVGEFDGMGKYDSPDALRAEKIRQEEIESLGHAVVRWTWADLEHRPGATAARIERVRRRHARYRSTA